MLQFYHMVFVTRLHHKIFENAHQSWMATLLHLGCDLRVHEKKLEPSKRDVFKN